MKVQDLLKTSNAFRRNPSAVGDVNDQRKDTLKTSHVFRRNPSAGGDVNVQRQDILKTSNVFKRNPSVRAGTANTNSFRGDK